MLIKFSKIAALGRALMLPIAMLPVAGLLLRFGQPDLLNIKAIAEAGNTIFANLPLLFAIGVAVGFAKDNNGAAGLAGAVGYLILLALLKGKNAEIDTGVFGGIISGALAGAMYNRYNDLKLPEFLAFFGGKRFVPIITGILSVVLGLLLGLIWPPIQHGLHTFSLWMANSGEIGLFIFGFFNRILLITGLHHILNSLFWFQLGDFTTAAGHVVHGDIARFMAGDPSAGHFMAGFFPIMMFGLPGVCLAMYSTAKAVNRTAVAGMLLSMALTSFLTGVTEPIEYSFVFLAPILYVLHAVITGISMALMFLFQVRLGFSFSAGAIDYVLFYKLATNPLIALLFGVLVFIVYYILALFFIKKFNLPTIGREAEEDAAAAVASVNLDPADLSSSSQEMQFVSALGGAENLVQVDACTTRLRLVVREVNLINKARLKYLGAKGVIVPSADSVQVILGPQAEIIASKIRDACRKSTKLVKLDNSPSTVLAALGGKNNLISVEVSALTRVKIVLHDDSLLQILALKDAGVLEIINISKQVKQLYLGDNASEFVQLLTQNKP